MKYRLIALLPLLGLLASCATPSAPPSAPARERAAPPPSAAAKTVAPTFLPRVMIIVDEKSLGTIAASEIEAMAVQMLLDNNLRVVDQDMVRANLKKDQQMLKSVGDKAVLASIGRQVAMHVAATAPLAVRAEEVDAAVAERERNVFIEQSRASGKPDAIIEKMVEGRMRKFFEEVALLSQAFVINPDLTVAAAVKEAEKTVGAPIEVTGMARLLLGEGVEKEATDFAAEVAAAAKG